MIMIGWRCMAQKNYKIYDYELNHLIFLNLKYIVHKNELIRQHVSPIPILNTHGSMSSYLPLVVSSFSTGWLSVVMVMETMTAVNIYMVRILWKISF